MHLATEKCSGDVLVAAQTIVNGKKTRESHNNSKKGFNRGLNHQNLRLTSHNSSRPHDADVERMTAALFRLFSQQTLLTRDELDGWPGLRPYGRALFAESSSQPHELPRTQTPAQRGATGRSCRQTPGYEVPRPASPRVVPASSWVGRPLGLGWQPCGCAVRLSLPGVGMSRHSGQCGGCFHSVKRHLLPEVRVS